MKYYYLIAGLPDLSLDMERSEIDFDETHHTIYRNLVTEDQLQYRYLLYNYDNENLLRTIFKQVKGYSLDGFVQPSIFSREEIRDYGRQKSAFPDYMQEFLDRYADQFKDLTMSVLADRLYSLFHSEIENRGNDFVKTFYHLDRTLKTVLAAYNYSAYPEMPRPIVEADNALYKQIGKGKTLSVAMTRAYPFLESLLEILALQEPMQLEKAVDQIVWDFVENIDGFFETEQVLAYSIKLNIVQRWIGLYQENGESHLQKLTEEIKKISRYP